MKVIDLTTKSAELHVQLDPSPVYDFLAALYLVENWSPEKGFDVDRTWVVHARDHLGSALRDDLRLFAKKGGILMGVVALLAQRPGVSVREFIKAVGSTPPGEMLARVLAAPHGARAVAPQLPEVLGSPNAAAIRAFLAAYPSEFDRSRLRRVLTMGPRRVSARLVDLLRGFYGKVYQQEEPTVLPLLVSDVQAKMGMLRTESPSAVVEHATGGYAISPERGTHVVLAPSFFFRPYNLLCEYPGVRVFIYPLDVNSPQPSPVRELERFFRALSEQTRLKILLLLADREMYLQEIADRVNISHATAIHHLALLRAAHIVRVVDRQHVKYYSLRRESLAQVGARMGELLGN